MKLALLRAALAMAREGRTAILVTDLRSGAQCLLPAGGRADGGLALDPAALARLSALTASARLDLPSGPVFAELFAPPLRCIIIGAVHTGQALALMARLAAYEVTVVDPRPAFAAAERFPGIALSREWPDLALARLRPDFRSAVICLGHDPKIDDPALAAALRSGAFYIGALGSRKTQAARRTRLAGAGFAEADLARIHGPVGLAIGALTPAEIAVSILAEMTAVLRRCKAPALPPG